MRTTAGDQMCDVWAGPMGTFWKVMALSAGALGGMGLGFYLKEHYYLRQNKERRDELVTELQRLREQRKNKEQRLKAFDSTTTSRTV